MDRPLSCSWARGHELVLLVGLCDGALPFGAAVMVQEAMRSSMEECRATRRRLEQTRDGEGATRGVSNGKGLSSSPPQTISGSTSEDSDDI